MSEHSGIEWTDATWNPVTGCTKVSPGCEHCYAERITERFHGRGSFATVQRHPERLGKPLAWRTPRRVFVNSMSDLFHAEVPDEYIARVFAVMALTPQHTYQILTKRHARMRSLLRDANFGHLVAEQGRAHHIGCQQDWLAVGAVMGGPLPNVWLGVSVENQQWADTRVPALLGTPAAVRFLSCEPLLGPVEFHPEWIEPELMAFGSNGGTCLPRIDWVIAGGESGPSARPMHPDWARSLRDQCQAAEVAFLFKQWGEWAPHDGPPAGSARYRDHAMVRRMGKKAAGRVLDGRTWDEFPQQATTGGVRA